MKIMLNYKNYVNMVFKDDMQYCGVDFDDILRIELRREES